MKLQREATSCGLAATNCKSESQEGKGRDLRVETSAHPTGHQTNTPDLELNPHSVEREAAARLKRMVRSKSALEWNGEGTQ